MTRVAKARRKEWPGMPVRGQGAFGSAGGVTRRAMFPLRGNRVFIYSGVGFGFAVCFGAVAAGPATCVTLRVASFT